MNEKVISLEESQMTTQQRITKNKVGLLELGRKSGNVSQAYWIIGHSRDSYYRYRQFYESGDEASL